MACASRNELIAYVSGNQRDVQREDTPSEALMQLVHNLDDPADDDRFEAALSTYHAGLSRNVLAIARWRAWRMAFVALGKDFAVFRDESCGLSPAQEARATLGVVRRPVEHREGRL